MEQQVPSQRGHGAATTGAYIRRWMFRRVEVGRAQLYILTGMDRQRWAGLWHLCTDIFSYCIITIRCLPSGGLLHSPCCSIVGPGFPESDVLNVLVQQYSWKGFFKRERNGEPLQLDSRVPPSMVIGFVDRPTAKMGINKRSGSG